MVVDRTNPRGRYAYTTLATGFTVNRENINFAPSASFRVYSCRPSRRGRPLTPMTRIMSPVPRVTLGAVTGISTPIPNRSLMIAIVARCDGFRHDTSFPRWSIALISLTPLVIPILLLLMMQFVGNIEGAIPNPKYSMFPPSGWNPGNCARPDAWCNYVVFQASSSFHNEPLYHKNRLLSRCKQQK